VYPALLAIVLMVISCNVLGDALRGAVDVKARRD